MNCGEIINVCKKLRLKLPGIGVQDIIHENRKLIIGDMQIKDLKDQALLYWIFFAEAMLSQRAKDHCLGPHSERRTTKKKRIMPSTSYQYQEAWGVFFCFGKILSKVNCKNILVLVFSLFEIYEELKKRSGLLYLTEITF